jgi:site-specific DNA-methyltransferase (adenine-specific)
MSLTPYYDDGRGIVIYHGDCREILPTLGKFDLLLTDPPYDISTSGGGIGGRRKYLSDIRGKIDEGFDMSILAPFPNWFCFCAKAQLLALLNAAQDGDRWQLITWNKTNPTPLCDGNYLPDTEYIVHSFASGRLFGEFRDKSRFIVQPVEKNGFEHPTVKPLAVMGKLVRLGSQVGEIIVDPYCGSGSTLVAAKENGRRCVGIEREERYCEIAARRLQQEVLAL